MGKGYCGKNYNLVNSQYEKIVHLTKKMTIIEVRKMHESLEKIKGYSSYYDWYDHISIYDLRFLISQAEKAKRYEKVIHNIANIDTLFINPDGTDREWDDKEALQEIENMVKPIWDEHCEKSWEKHRQKAKESK
jgi:hypothetical protein